MLVMLEIFLLVCLGLFVLSQVILPLITNVPMFPIFRLMKLEKEVAKAREELRIANLQKEIVETKEVAHNITPIERNSDAPSSGTGI